VIGKSPDQRRPFSGLFHFDQGRRLGAQKRSRGMVGNSAKSGCETTHPAPFRQSSLKPARWHLRVRGKARSGFKLDLSRPDSKHNQPVAVGFATRFQVLSQSRAGSKRGRPRRLPKPTTAGGGVGPERNRLSFKPSPGPLSNRARRPAHRVRLHPRAAVEPVRFATPLRFQTQPRPAVQSVRFTIQLTAPRPSPVSNSTGAAVGFQIPRPNSELDRSIPTGPVPNPPVCARKNARPEADRMSAKPQHPGFPCGPPPWY
jgi:hypothetical protein